MLTRENFKDTWARPKPEEKGKTEGEAMGVDMSPESRRRTKHQEDHDTEMGNTPVAGIVEDSVDDRTMEIEGKEETRNGRLQSRASLKMPVFAFQRRGIGAAKPNFQHPKHKPKT